MSNYEDQASHRHFEDEVRRICRALWPMSRFDGAVNIQGRERDGVFVSEDVVHVVEVTTSRKLDKAKDDAKKICELARSLRISHSDKVVRGWLITSHEPTADQREAAEKVAKKSSIKLTTSSFENFRSRLIDGSGYLDARNNYRFGSVVNLIDNSWNVGADEYVDLEIIDRRNISRSLAVPEIALAIREGEKFLLIGDYGAGKSMTLRQIYFALRSAFMQRKHSRFPMYLNLRDHQGQSDPSEALHRHAKSIGFEKPDHLVRAWRAGLCDIILDGFDELAPAGWVGVTKKLRMVRYESMKLIRNIVDETRSPSGLIVAGRMHYFDNEAELVSALQVGSNFTFLSLNEFTDEQIRGYLQKKGLVAAVPLWVPARPLLLGYLVAKGIFREGQSYPADPALGWDSLLQRICQREASIEANLDGESVRRVIERLASISRHKPDGLGPLSPHETTIAFHEAVGYSPDDQGRMLLMRLPGLGPDTAEEGVRRFIDQDLADAARAGELHRFIDDPFNADRKWLVGADNVVGELAIEIVAGRLRSGGVTDKKLSTALSYCRQLEDTAVLRADIAGVISAGAWKYTGEPISIDNIFIRELSFNNTEFSLSNVEFNNCIITRLMLDSAVGGGQLPNFRSCSIEHVEGRLSVADLPTVFDAECDFEDFSDARTNSEIFELPLPIGVKVLLTILKKLFLQKGSGRRESALSRGLDHRDRQYVGEVLKLIESEGVAVRHRMREQYVWVPTRNDTARVRKILAAPTTSIDALVRKASVIASN